MSKIVCVGYISFMMGLAISDFGQVIPCAHETVSIELITFLFFMLFIPAFSGYFAGKNDAELKK